jgi:hypothetical protein
MPPLPPRARPFPTTRHQPLPVLTSAQPQHGLCWPRAPCNYHLCCPVLWLAAAADMASRSVLSIDLGFTGTDALGGGVERAGGGQDDAEVQAAPTFWAPSLAAGVRSPVAGTAWPPPLRLGWWRGRGLRDHEGRSVWGGVIDDRG